MKLVSNTLFWMGAMTALFTPAAFAQQTTSPNTTPPQVIGRPPTTTPPTPPVPPQNTPRTQPQTPATLPQSAQVQTNNFQSRVGEAPDEIRASQMLGSDVKGQDGQTLGTLEDLLINPQDKSVNYAIVGQKGLLGTTEKRVPVPWQSAQLRSEVELTLNMTAQQFKAAPTVTPNDYSILGGNTNTSTNTVVGNIFRYFQGLGAGAPGTNAGGTITGQGQR